MNNKQWYKLADVESLSAGERACLTEQYVNPGMVKLFKILGFDKIWPLWSQGPYIYLEKNKKILDMTGGNCVLGLGHNHPRILAARRRIASGKRLEMCKSFLSPYVAALAANMAAILPGDLQYSFFCNSGAEAIEGALKLAEKCQGSAKSEIVYTDHSFHGKTHAAMSVSSLDQSRNNFRLLPGCFEVPYGDSRALENYFHSRIRQEKEGTGICAFIVEAIHGTRLVFPPPGYLKKVRRLCDKYGVLLIIDEIYTGFCRTGDWFAFEAEGIIPDIVCYSKAFGGGKATIAGYTARSQVFLKAYGKPQDSMIHSSTYSGMSEECATAIEALNIMKDENTAARAKELGVYLGEKLDDLKNKYPAMVMDVRGRGLMWGVEIKPPLGKFEPFIEKILSSQAESLSKLAGAVILSELFHSHNVLAYLGFTRRNLIVFTPPLFISKKDLDYALDSLAAAIRRGWPNLIYRFGQRFIKKK